MKKSDVKVGDRVSVKERVEGYYSNYGGNTAIFLQARHDRRGQEPSTCQACAGKTSRSCALTSYCSGYRQDRRERQCITTNILQNSDMRISQWALTIHYDLKTNLTKPQEVRQGWLKP